MVHGGGHRASSASAGTSNARSSSSTTDPGSTAFFGAGHHGGGNRQHAQQHNQRPVNSTNATSEAPFSHNNVFFWNSPQYQQPAVVFTPTPIATTRTTYYQSPVYVNRQTSGGSPHYTSMPQVQNTHIAGRTSGASGYTPMPQVRNTHTVATTSTMNQNPQDCNSCCCTPSPHLLKRHQLTISSIACWILVAFLGVFTCTSFTTQQFTLNPGETRRIASPSPFLYKSVSTSYSSTSNTVSANTYYYPHSNGPPLTGPQVTLSAASEPNLAFGDYEYDYFYLNPGSQITVSMDVYHGSANVWLLRGKNTFDAWCGGNDYVARPLVKQFAASGSAPHISFNYTVSEADVYYVTYDNPHQHDLIGSETVTILATSFAVSEEFKVPSCPPSTSPGKCRFALEFGFWRHDSIIVQATSTSSDVAGKDVMIVVAAQRRWLVLWACVALIVSMLAVCCGPKQTPVEAVRIEERRAFGSGVQYSPIPPPAAYSPDAVLLGHGTGPQEIPIVEATLVQEPSAPPKESD